MEHVGSVIGKIKTPVTEPVKIAEQCANCGTIVQFSEKQWRKPCHQCGLSITISERRPRGTKQIQCFACEDKGVIIYMAQVDGDLYEYGAKCLCAAGTKYKGLPSIDQVGNAPDYQSIWVRNKMRLDKNEAV